MSSSLYAADGEQEDALIAIPDDPYTSISNAVSLPPDSQEQADALLSATTVLESQPTFIEQICPALLENLTSSPETMLKVWVMDMVSIGLGRAKLTMEQKTQLSEKVLVSMNTLLHDPSTTIVKLAIRCFISMLPLLFRQICVTRPPPAQIHSVLLAAKNTIISLALSTSVYPIPSGQSVQAVATVVPVNSGVRGLAWKFVQKVMVVGTKGGSSDPRLQSKSDPNLNLCPPDHPLIRPNELTIEVNFLIEQMITTFYQQDDPAILHPLINVIPALVKSRPSLAPAFLPALASWSPNTMTAKARPFLQIKAVEKTLKVVIVYLLRSGQHSAFQPQLTDALSRQTVRLTASLKEEKAAKEARILAARTGIAIDLKRPASAESSLAGAKRARIRSPSPQRIKEEVVAAISPPASGPGSGDCKGPEFDVTSLQQEVVQDLLMASLGAVDPVKLAAACELMRRISSSSSNPAMRVMSTVLGAATLPAPVSVPVPIAPALSTPLSRDSVRQPETDDMLLDPENDEINMANLAADVDEYDDVVQDEEVAVADPLAMLDDEEEESEDEQMEDVAATSAGEEEQEEVMPLKFLDFKLPPPEPLNEEARENLMLTALQRICITGRDVQGRLSAVGADVSSEQVEGYDDALRVGTTLNPREMWILLLSRLASRGIDGSEAAPAEGSSMAIMSEKTRQSVCDFVAADFAGRSKLATCWLNEEWYNERLTGASNNSSNSTYTVWLRTLLQTYIGRMEGSDKSLTRFLLDLPEISEETVSLLRGLCQESEKAVIGFTTLREIVNMRPPVRHNALQTLLDLTTHSDRKVRLLAINTVKRWVPDMAPMNAIVVHYALQMVRRLATPVAEEEREEGMEEGEEVEEKVVSTYVPEVFEMPIQRDLVQQHVELLFALSVRDADLLDEIFNVYPRMDPSVRQAVEVLLTPLIRSLGPTHTKLLTILRSFPAASEALALRVLTILTENGKPGPSIVAMVKTLMLERDLDARFLIPIAADMDKAEIHRFMPKMVGILCNKPAERDMVRQVFRHVVAPPVDLSQSTNVAREKTDDLSAADLLVLLHDQEKEIGIKAAMEAIDICFSLTDLFPSEVFAVFMQRIIDGTTLPVLFMRTVIRAVSTYRSLGGFVSTTLFSRLITKKIWTNPQLWKGFTHCAKLIAPQSFGALLQLPREQLKDLVESQASIKPALWQFVVSKAGVAKAQSYADIFGNIPNIAPQPMANQYQPISTM